MELGVFGLRLTVFPGVYRPAEDSLMLAEHAAKLRGRILDVGCGCGIQGLVCAAASRQNRVVGLDIRPRAVENAKLNAARNSLDNASFAAGDLFLGVRGKFDAIVFNPPYLPTSDDERVAGPINSAFDGGTNGRKVTDRFLRSFGRYLKKRGTLLIVESSLAGIEKTEGRLEGMGYRAEIVAEQRFFFERLVVIRARKAGIKERCKRCPSSQP